jgi:hypothetical protein
MNKKKAVENYKEVTLMCERCNDRILNNKYISPYDIYTYPDKELAVFSDGTYRVHKKCLTKEELKHLKKQEET